MVFVTRRRDEHRNAASSATSAGPDLADYLNSTMSPATYFWNQNNLAPRLQLNRISILENLAIDRDSHALLDLRPQTGKPALQLQHQPPERGRFHVELGPATGELVAGPARSERDFRQAVLFTGCGNRRQDSRR